MKPLSTINKLLLVFFGFSAVVAKNKDKDKTEDCTKFVDELATFCRYDKNTGVNQLRKIRFLTDKKTLKKNCDIFKDIPDTDIEECEEEEEENKNIKMIDFFTEEVDDYKIFNVKTLKEDGSECEDCAKWTLNKETIDMFPEQSNESFKTYFEMEIQTNEVIINNCQIYTNILLLLLLLLL